MGEGGVRVKAGRRVAEIGVERWQAADAGGREGGGDVCPGTRVKVTDRRVSPQRCTRGSK